MLIEIWERIRGYDKWIQTEAKVASSDLIEIDFPLAQHRTSQPHAALGWKSTCQIVWSDHNCNQHSGSFEAVEESPLYQLCEGESISIRFNPTNPDQFYVSGLLHSNVLSGLKATLWTIILVLVLIAFFVPEIFRFLSSFSH